MAAGLDAVPYGRLHHVIGAGLWDSAPQEAALWRQAEVTPNRRNLFLRNLVG